MYGLGAFIVDGITSYKSPLPFFYTLIIAFYIHQKSFSFRRPNDIGGKNTNQLHFFPRSVSTSHWQQIKDGKENWKFIISPILLECQVQFAVSFLQIELDTCMGSFQIDLTYYR